MSKKNCIAAPMQLAADINQEGGQQLSIASKRYQNGLMSNNNEQSSKKREDVKVSQIIGDFGPYQITVVIFAALRALSCAMDGLSGPFISPNVKHFQCEICDISSPYNSANSSIIVSNVTAQGTCNIYFGETTKMHYELDGGQCFFKNTDSLRPDRFYCEKWSFNNIENERLMNSLTVEQSLVCDREWLKSLSNSMYFVGATFGLLFWGIISDRYGRKTAYVCSHFVTLIFGFCALFTDSMSTYIILRSINAFGMIGELIPRSIQVEIVATEYRFVCSVICQIGWATGIILVPLLAYINPGYRFILAFPVVLSAIMLPWLIWLPESARWLITNQNYPRARDELRRAARINGKLTDDIDEKIEQFNRQVLREEVGAIGNSSSKRMGVWRSILAIFTNIHLLKDTMSVFVLLFVAEVVYFSLTLNVADLGGSIYINYIISGLSELVSIAFCAVILAYLPRRVCLSLLLLASTISYLLMALVNVYEESLSMTLILAVNAFGKLTAIGNLMVIILVSQEVFPTVIRQFGTSLCITIGKAGSAVAPFTHELGQIIGHSYCFGMFSLICLSCAIVPCFLSETGNRELPDTVIDVEEGAAKRSRKRMRSKYPESGKFVALYESTEMPATKINANEANGHVELNEKVAFPNNHLGLTMLIDKLDQSKKQSLIEDENNNNVDGSSMDRSYNRVQEMNHLRPQNANHHNSSLSNLSSTIDTTGDLSQASASESSLNKSNNN